MNFGIGNLQKLFSKPDQKPTLPDQKQPDLTEAQRIVLENQKEGLSFVQHEKYNTDEFRTAFSEDADESTLDSLQTLETLIQNERDNEILLFGDSEGYIGLREQKVNHYFLSTYIVPYFHKRAAGKTLRPEAVANTLFAAFQDMKDIKDISRDKMVDIGAQRYVSPQNYSDSLKERVMYDRSNLAALITALIPDATQDVRAAVYASMTYNDMFDEAVPIEKYEEIGKSTGLI